GARAGARAGARSPAPPPARRPERAREADAAGDRPVRVLDGALRVLVGVRRAAAVAAVALPEVVHAHALRTLHPLQVVPEELPLVTGWPAVPFPRHLCSPLCASALRPRVQEACGGLPRPPRTRHHARPRPSGHATGAQSSDEENDPGSQHSRGLVLRRPGRTRPAATRAGGSARGAGTDPRRRAGRYVRAAR